MAKYAGSEAQHMVAAAALSPSDLAQTTQIKRRTSGKRFVYPWICHIYPVVLTRHLVQDPVDPTPPHRAPRPQPAPSPPCDPIPPPHRKGFDLTVLEDSADLDCEATSCLDSAAAAFAAGHFYGKRVVRTSSSRLAARVSARAAAQGATRASRRAHAIKTDKSRQ